MPIEHLEPGESVRLGEVQIPHLQALIELAGKWPPVLVTGDGRIVDGHYRHLAAKRLGHTHLDCVIFTGEDSEAFVEAVRRNAAHGLPLTLDERRMAARRVLILEPDWSDRRIASLCGLAHETVGRIRRRLTAGGEIRHLARRKGRDGRYQLVGSARVIAPVDRARGREAAGVPARRAEDPSTDPHGPVGLIGPIGPISGVVSRPYLVRVAGRALAPVPARDAAFTSTDDGRSFVEWFEANAIGEDWTHHIASVPLSRVYEIADEARRRAAAWSGFAGALSSRASRRTSGPAAGELG